MQPDAVMKILLHGLQQDFAKSTSAQPQQKPIVQNPAKA